MDPDATLAGDWTHVESQPLAPSKTEELNTATFRERRDESMLRSHKAGNARLRMIPEVRDHGEKLAASALSADAGRVPTQPSDVLEEPTALPRKSTVRFPATTPHIAPQDPAKGGNGALLLVLGVGFGAALGWCAASAAFSRRPATGQAS
jgi:hypothetical protein